MHNLPHHTRTIRAINASIQVQWMLVTAALFVGLWYVACNEADKRFAMEDRVQQEQVARR